MLKRTILTLTTLVFLLIFLYAAGDYFSGDFEEGDLTDWDGGTSITGDGVIDAHADAAHSVSWGSRNYTENEGRAYGEGLLNDDRTQFHVTFWFKLHADFTMGAADAFHVARSVSGARFWGVTLTEDTGDIKVGAFHLDHGPTMAEVISKNTWYQVDVWWKRQSGVDVEDGEFKVWLNTVNKVNSTGVDDNSSAITHNEVFIGAYTGIEATTSGYLYIDDVDCYSTEQEVGGNGEDENAIFFGMNFLVLLLLVSFVRRKGLLCLLVILLLTSLSFATDYFVKTGGNDGASGLDDANAWVTVSKVNGFSFSNASDAVYFNKGDTWKEKLVPPRSGNGSNQFTFGAYGTGADPIITARGEVTGWNTGGNWSDQGGNVWSMTFSTNVRRLWLDGTEYLHDTSSAVDSTNRWYWSSNTLYVYATENPSTFYTSMEGGDVGRDSAVFNNGEAYITFQNLDLRGGYRTVFENGSDNNIYDTCAIGLDAFLGIHAGNGANDTEVKDCSILSGFSFTYTAEAQSISDALRLEDGALRWLVHDNELKDWGHCAIYLIGGAGGNAVNNNEFYDNEIHAPNVSYCRAIATEGAGIGQCQGNKFYRNDIHDMTVRDQPLGDANEIYYNLYYDYAISDCYSNRSHAIELTTYSNLVCTGNKIYNNVFANMPEPGIVIADAGGSNDIELNIIRNNIFYNCGNNTQQSKPYSLWMEDWPATIGANTFENNCFFQSGVSDVIYNGHETGNDYARTVAEFNGDTGEGGNTIANNIGDDPVLVNPGADDLHIQTNSPCKDTGVDVGLVLDYWGNMVWSGTAPDIGAHEFQQGDIPTALIRDVLLIRDVFVIR